MNFEKEKTAFDATLLFSLCYKIIFLRACESAQIKSGLIDLHVYRIHRITFETR